MKLRQVLFWGGVQVALQYWVVCCKRQISKIQFWTGAALFWSRRLDLYACFLRARCSRLVPHKSRQAEKILGIVEGSKFWYFLFCRFVKQKLYFDAFGFGGFGEGSIVSEGTNPKFGLSCVLQWSCTGVFDSRVRDLWRCFLFVAFKRTRPFSLTGWHSFFVTNVFQVAIWELHFTQNARGNCVVVVMFGGGLSGQKQSYMIIR